MKIYLEHKLHGRKVAYQLAEAEADKKNGWTEYNPEAPPVTENYEAPRRGRPRKED